MESFTARPGWEGALQRNDLQDKHKRFRLRGPEALHRFYGSRPSSPLFVNGSTLYGTTLEGGSGIGTLFKVNTDGSAFAVLRRFKGYPSDGAYPWADVILDGVTLYGTTKGGGSMWNIGSVFSFVVRPRIELNDPGFGATSNSFAFNISGILDQPVVIEACTNIATAEWLPLQTNTMGPCLLRFQDTQWTAFPNGSIASTPHNRRR